MVRHRSSAWLVRACTFLACLAAGGIHPVSAGAQEIPVVDQPPGDFYNASGAAVRVEWQLDRTTVPEDEELVATLVVTGATNPREIVRPDLRKLRPFESRFVIPDGETPPPAADAKAVRFTYRLRPRNRSVDRVPTLAFHYFNPAAAEGKQFPLTTAREKRISVTAPRPKAEAPPVPLGEPEWLLTYTPKPVSLARPALAAEWAWAAVALGGPLAALAWFAVWRRIYPDAGRLARLRKSRAARRAADAIGRAGGAPDPAAAVAAAVLGYLRARFPIPPGAATPAELSAALADAGLPAADAAAVAEFFRACDAARFSGAGEASETPAADARAIVARLEAA